MLEHDTVCLDFERMYKKGSHCHIVTGLHSAFYGFDLQCLSYIESDTPEKDKKKKKTQKGKLIYWQWEKWSTTYFQQDHLLLKTCLCARLKLYILTQSDYVYVCVCARVCVCVRVRVCVSYSPCRGPGMLLLLKRCLSVPTSSSLTDAQHKQRCQDDLLWFIIQS